ncbi:hypothetical protein [Cryptosporangium arvum]|uniref:hypothetical protein n=1 Tax=Cryptosporangium arvum TaxID=80871 RepID=UPI0004B18B67|nr:hypothetical protein [Cryptosporangium arvum]
MRTAALLTSVLTAAALVTAAPAAQATEHVALDFLGSEGERALPSTIGNPWIRIASREGAYRGEVRLPTHFTMSSEPTGPRSRVTEFAAFAISGV